MMEGGVGIKLGMISPELLKDYLEVWWTILSCAIALGRFSDFLISDWLWHHAPYLSTYQKIKPDEVLYVVTYHYVRRHNKVNEYNFIILKTINVLQIHEFLTLVWPLLLSMTSWHGLYTLPLYLFVIIYSRFQWVALGWFSYCFSTLGQSEARFLKTERQITTWPQDRKCNYFNFSCLYSNVYNYCHPCCRLSNISIPFWKDSRLWRFRDGYWCRKGYSDLLRMKIF